MTHICAQTSGSSSQVVCFYFLMAPLQPRIACAAPLKHVERFASVAILISGSNQIDAPAAVHRLCGSTETRKTPRCAP